MGSLTNQIFTNQTISQRINNTLLLNSSFIENLGLMHGKMGISIFFFNLARQTKNKIYEDYAGELIDEIYEEISVNTPVDFENGLAGIGWGIEYLVQNGFIEADTNEVLEEFDKKIFNELINNSSKQIGLLTGLIGYGFYFLKRLQCPVRKIEKTATLTIEQSLNYIIDELDRRTESVNDIISEPLKHFTSQTFEPSNFQSLESLNHKSHTTDNNTFDLTWNYPVLLWFFTELYKQNIFNGKIEKIIKRLIELLTIENNLPILQSNKLLLTLGLTKLQKSINYKQQTPKPSNLESIITNLTAGINRNTIKSEFPPKNVTIRYGSLGIALIYKQLFKLTRKSKFKDEFVYWVNQNSLNEIEDNNSAEGIRNIENCGMLEGFSGSLFINL